MVEVAQSYEMVRNFNNWKGFVMFAAKKLEAFFDYAYVGPENFFDLRSSPPPPPPRRQHFREKFVRLGQNPRK